MTMGMQTVRQLALSSIIPAILFLGGVLHPHAATAATYYMATNGDDANPGTQARPFRSIAKGLTGMKAGDTLYLRAGTYLESIDSDAQRIPTGTSWSNAVTIAAYPNEKVTLKGVIKFFAYNTDYALQYIIVDRLIVDASHLSGPGASGITIMGDQSAKSAHHIRIQYSEVFGVRGNGGAPDNANHVFLSGYNNEVIYSSIHGGDKAYGFYMNGQNNMVAHCDIYNNGGYAIHIFDGGQVSKNNNHIIRNNRMYNNGYQLYYNALTVNNGDGSLIYNNVIYNSFGGINVRYGSPKNVQIYNNTLYNNGSGIEIGYDGTTPSNTSVKNNIVFQSGIVDGGTGVNNNISHNETNNPSFVNAADGSFHLMSGSSAIDAGVAVSLVTTDHDGTPRPQRAQFDIGAYEYRGFQLAAPTNLRKSSVAP